MNKKHLILILILVSFFYLLISSNFFSGFQTTQTNYFNYLAEAFIHKKPYLISNPSNKTDLIFFKDRLYLYWPPVPALSIMPIIALFGLSASDILYTVVIGILNCIIFYFMLGELKKSNLCHLSEKNQLTLTLFFAFGTNHFYLSLFGRVWFTQQLFALFFLIFAIFLILKHYNTKQAAILLFSSTMFSLSVYSRNTIILTLPFFIAVILNTKKFLLRKLIIFLVPFMFLSAFNLIYNYLRFDSMFNNGVKMHLMNPFFYQVYEKHGFFNFVYFPKNLFYNFLNPVKFTPEFPFIAPDPIGNGLVFTSPLFLLLFTLKKKQIMNSKKHALFFLPVILTTIITLIPSLILFGTGWFQFGSRYLLDIIPFLIILLIPVLKNTNNKIVVILISISIFINTMGVFWWRSLNI